MKSAPTVSFLTVLAASALSSVSADAAITVSLPGTSEHGGWNELNNSRLTGFPGGGNTTGAWPNALTPNMAGSATSAEFNKISGGGYPTSPGTNAIYTLFAAGQFSVADAAPIAGLETVVLQLDVDGGSPPPTFNILPSLSYNGGTQNLPAGISFTTPGGYSSNVMGPSVSTNYVFQWDLSGLAEDVTSYTINWGHQPHSLIFEVNVTAGDTFAQVVPEPSGVMLSLGALACGLLRRRR